MKKLVLVICTIGLLLILSSCNSKYSLQVNNPDKIVDNFSAVASFCDMAVIAKDGDARIWMDKNTGVLYYRFVAGYNGAITAIMKPDGTCLTFDEWKEKVNYKEY